MEKEYKYDAFISYRHLSPDKPIAEKLQKLLEEYAPPKSVNDGKGKKKLRLFRDESELPTSNDLGGDIKTALEQSRFLVVICSENFEKSKWCMQEVAYFQELHGGSNKQILTLYVGDPDLPPVFPDALRFEPKKILHPDGTETVVREEVEPLAANVSAKTTKDSLKKLKTEFLRIAAPLFGCGFDDLYQREQRRRARRRLSAAAAVFAFLVIASVFGTFAVQQKKQINYKNAESLVYQSKTLESDGDLFEALRTVTPALPEKEGGTVPANRAVEQVVSLTGAYDPELFTATKKIALSDEVIDICLMNGGKSLLVITRTKTYNKTFSLWDTQTGELIREFEGRVIYYHDNRIDGNLSVEKYANGIYASQQIGNHAFYGPRYKTITEEKNKSEDAVFYINEEENVLYKISPVDGTALWSKEGKWSFLCLSENNIISRAGLPVILTEEEEDSYGFSNQKDSICFLDFDNGEEIGRITYDELETAIDGFSNFNLKNVFFEKQYLVIEYSDEEGLSLYVFKNGVDLSRFSIKIALKDFYASGTSSVKNLLIDKDLLFVVGKNGEEIPYAFTFFNCYDLSDGQQKWSYSKHAPVSKYFSKGYIGLFRSSDLTGNEREKIFGIVDSEIFVVDPETGEDLGSKPLINPAKTVYFSDNGLVFVVDSDGDETVFSLNDEISFFDKSRWDVFTVLVNNFRTKIKTAAAYCNNTYAFVCTDDKEVVVYTRIDNDNKHEIYKGEGKDKFNDTIINADRSVLAARKSVDEKPEIHVIDCESKQPLCIIKYDENSDFTRIISFDFLKDKSVVVNSSYKDYNKLEIYDVLTGKLTEECEYDSSKDCVAVSYSSNEIFVGSDGTVRCISPGREEETVFDSKECLLREIKEEDLPDSYSVSDICVSPSGEKLAMFCSYSLTDEDSGEHMLILDRKTGTIVELREFSVESSYDIENTVWSSDEDKLFLLTEGFIYAYDCSGGEKVFEIKLESRAGVIFMLEGKLCFSDDHGNLSLIDPKSGKEIRSKKLALNETVYSSLKTEFIPVGKNRGFVRIGDAAWLIDTKEFEIIFKVDNFSGYDPEKEIIYTTYYNYIYSYPVLSPFELRQRAESILN